MTKVNPPVKKSIGTTLRRSILPSVRNWGKCQRNGFRRGLETLYPTDLGFDRTECSLGTGLTLSLSLKHVLFRFPELVSHFLTNERKSPGKDERVEWFDQGVFFVFSCKYLSSLISRTSWLIKWRSYAFSRNKSRTTHVDHHFLPRK